MAMPAWVPEAWSRLNADNQKQVGNFLQFLLFQQEAQAIEDGKPKTSRVQYDKGQNQGL